MDQISEGSLRRSALSEPSHPLPRGLLPHLVRGVTPPSEFFVIPSEASRFIFPQPHLCWDRDSEGQSVPPKRTY